ncbi:hypothetical protein L1887_23926 [Cichorium endivia]|nr:hypothetical protein L1887_23926 [Cichorium endivia]
MMVHSRSTMGAVGSRKNRAHVRVPVLFPFRLDPALNKIDPTDLGLKTASTANSDVVRCPAGQSNGKETNPDILSRRILLTEESRYFLE